MVYWKENLPKDKTMHEGHRKRMTERVRRAEESLSDHELLEVILFGSIPRKNTNEIAHTLIDTFGGLQGVFSASFEQLLSVDGVGEATASLIRCIALCQRKGLDEELFGIEDAGAYGVLSAHLSKRYAGLSYEVMELFDVDPNNRIRHFRRFTSTDATRVTVEPHEISKFITDYRPKALIVAHNHVFHNCRPSAEDDVFTEQTQIICSLHNVQFYDHIIVSPVGNYSYRILGALDDICEKLTVDNILKGIKP